MRTECEMCGKMRVCQDGICKACDRQLEKIISITYLLALGFTITAPYIIGMNEINKTRKDGEA